MKDSKRRRVERDGKGGSGVGGRRMAVGGRKEGQMDRYRVCAAEVEPRKS